MLGAGTVAARVRSVKAQPDAQPDVPRRRRQAVSASLETPRLRLRRLVPADEADLIALDSDPDVMRNVGSPAGVKSPEETAERVKRRVLDSGRGDHGGLGFSRGAGGGHRALLRVRGLGPGPDPGQPQGAHPPPRAPPGP